MLRISNSNLSLSDGFYIGYTGNSIQKRLKEHINEARYSSKRTKKLNWLRNYCRDVVRIQLLQDNILTEKEALEREVFYIDLYKNSEFGASMKNGDAGGIGGTKNYTEEVIEKIRISKLGNTWNRGRVLSDEVKRKIGEGNKGKVLSKETREKVSKTLKERNKILRDKGEFKYKSRKFTEQDILKMFCYYNKNLLSCTDIGKVMDCSADTVKNALNGNCYLDWKEKHQLKTEKRPKGYMSLVRQRQKREQSNNQ